MLFTIYTLHIPLNKGFISCNMLSKTSPKGLSKIFMIIGSFCKKKKSFSWKYLLDYKDFIHYSKSKREQHSTSNLLAGDIQQGASKYGCAEVNPYIVTSL